MSCALISLIEDSHNLYEVRDSEDSNDAPPKALA